MANPNEDGFGDLQIGPVGEAPSVSPSGSKDDFGDLSIGPVGAPSAPSAPSAPTTAANLSAPLQPIGKPEPADLGVGEMFSQAWQSAPSSAMEFGKSLAQPFLHPVETAQAIGALGKGAYSKAAGALGVEQKPEQKAQDEAAVNALADFYRDRYGSVARFKQAFAKDPVGVFADASTVLTGGGSLAAKAPGLLGKAGEAAASVGRTVDPLATALKVPAVAAKGISYATNVPLAFQTGTSMRSLNQATQAGLTANPVFWNHLHGSGTAEDVVNAVKGAVSQVAKQRSNEYMQGMGSIASQQPLSYSKVDQALQDAMNVAFHKGQVRNQDAADVLAKINAEINSWRSSPNIAHNIEDFDVLKQRIRDIGYRDTYPNSPARKIVDDIANAAKATIPDQRYAAIMENYSRMTQKLNDLNRELLSGKTTGAQIRKLLKAQDDAHKSKLMSEIAAINPEIPFMIAGQELRPLLPSGIVGKLLGTAATYGGYNLALHPGALAGAFMSSPRVAGTLQYGIGRVSGLPSRTYQALPAPQMLGQAAEAARLTAPEERPQRATGGRIVNLKSLARSAKKAVCNSTEDLLKTPDEHVVKALEIANRSI